MQMGIILSIEDDSTISNILRIFLERFGYRFYSATSAVAGLEMAYETNPDVIIMDLLMPEMNGWEVIERLREDSDIPIIVLSALNDSDSKNRAFEAGADAYLTKPFRFDNLKDSIDDVFESPGAA